MMELTREEEAMLEGRDGEGVSKAMEILVALGEIYGAERMIGVKSAQIAGVSFKNLGDAGLEFLEDWAGKGAKVRVPSTLNPAGADVENWKALGISREFIEKQKRLIDAYTKMGITASCTCTPYLVGNRPSRGDHIAWSESSAVSYANSVLGALTNREGGPSALAAALTGKTPLYGLHLQENRKSDLVVDVKCPLKTVSDYGALGYVVGKQAKNRIPFFKMGSTERGSINKDKLKSLGASMAASGAVAMYHIKDVTPEASDVNVREEHETIVIEGLEEGYEALNSDINEIDFVAIGCPHASLAELETIAGLLKGKKVRSLVWITTSRKVRDAAREKGILNDITESGAHVVSDTCMIVAPVEELGVRSIATNAGKAAFYAPSHCDLAVRFGTLEECINAAVTGRWE